MKRKILTIFTVLSMFITFYLPVQIHAMEEDKQKSQIPDGISVHKPDADDDDLILINKILYDDRGVLLLHIGDSIESLELESEVYGMYNSSFVTLCQIEWDALDTNTPNVNKLEGKIKIPNGHAFEGNPPSLETIVIVYDDYGNPPIKTEYLDMSQIVLPQGASAQEVDEILKEFEAEAFSDYFYIRVNGEKKMIWANRTVDRSAINLEIPGLYFPFSFDLPSCFHFNENDLLKFGIFVVVRDKVVLSGVGFDPESGYHTKWIYHAQDPQIWLSVDDGDWYLEQDKGKNSTISTSFILDSKTNKTTGLIIDDKSLEKGHIYQIQLQYDGNRFSDVLVIDCTNSQAQMVGSGPDGDRTGVDREEHDKQPPSTGDGDGDVIDDDITNPAPDIEINKPPQQPAPPIQSDPPIQNNDDSDGDLDRLINDTPLVNDIAATQPENNLTSETQGHTVSGDRLIAMMEANPTHITFTKDDIWLSISTMALQELDIKTTDTLSVQFNMNGEESFSVSATLNGSEIDTLIPHPLLVTLNMECDDISILSDQGEVFPLEVANGKTTLSLSSGDYYLKPMPFVVTNPSPNDTSDIDNINFADENKPDPNSYQDNILPIIFVSIITVIAASIYIKLVGKRRSFK